VIATGGVKIVLPSTEGDEAIIASLKPGDFFGELALLDTSPRSTTATAIEVTETLTLPREQFLVLLQDDPELVRALLRALAEELRRLTGHVEELHFLDLAGRLSMRLVRLARDANPDAHGRCELDWPFTQSDLAAMIGGTRQSVNKLLSGLVEDGLISIERDTLVINDLLQLERHGSR
jgi:CRP/FNR family transcriptional regulator, cyclic AMP receptor protein